MRPRRRAGRVRRFLIGQGFFDLRSMENPSVVEGIPFVTMKVTPMVTHRAKVDLRPDSGRIIVNWRVDSTIDIEEDEVRLRGVDFAPMLLAWIEQERSKRRV